MGIAKRVDVEKVRRGRCKIGLLLLVGGLTGTRFEDCKRAILDPPALEPHWALHRRKTLVDARNVPAEAGIFVCWICVDVMWWEWISGWDEVACGL